MKTKNYFSTNLLLLLKRNKITQQKLAEMLDSKQSVISNWLTGKTKPSSKSILKLSEIFDIPVGDLFDKKQDISINNKKNSSNVSRIDFLEEQVKRHELEIMLLKEKIK